jgi:hypothetical protein
MISVGWIKCGSDGHYCDLAAGGRFPGDNGEGHMHSTVNLASTNDDHLQDHPDVLIFDQDDRFVLVRIKMPKRWLGRKLRFYERLVRIPSRLTRQFGSY